MRKFSAVAHIKDLNELKTNMANSFLNSEEFRLKLKSCGLPGNGLFWTFFKSSGIIRCIGNNSYVWVDKSPIHYTVLQGIYREYQKKVNHYAKTRQEKVKRCEDSTRIKKAISLLKEHGYKIWETHNGYFKEIQCFRCVDKLRQQ